MKLSILDQAPISSGKTAKDALEASIALAQIAEKYGYSRYWIAEHHDLSGLACSAPEVLLSYIGSKTERIRIGSGAVLLPHYQPYKVAETHNMLATLFPDRIDIGIGRSPGGSAEATLALSATFLEQVRKYPDSVKELLNFFNNSFPSDHMFSKIKASPLPPKAPEPWILGTSKKSALLAAENGVAYAYADFMSESDGSNIVELYRDNFKSSGKLSKPKSMIAIDVVCAETTELAEKLALSYLLWKLKAAKGEHVSGIPTPVEAENYPFTSTDIDLVNQMKSKLIMGNPQEVRQQLLDIQALYKADELMILTITHSYEARIQSYQLIAKEVIDKSQA